MEQRRVRLINQSLTFTTDLISDSVALLEALLFHPPTLTGIKLWGNSEYLHILAFVGVMATAMATGHTAVLKVVTSCTHVYFSLAYVF